MTVQKIILTYNIVRFPNGARNEEQGGKILFLQSREPHLGVLSAFTEMLPEHNNEQAGLCYPACCVNLVIFRQID